MSIVYKITGSVGAAGLWRPQTTTVTNGHILGTYLNEDGQDEDICEADWKDAPHVALANLPTYDKQEKLTMKPELGLRIDEDRIQWFIRTYGVLNEGSKKREPVEGMVEHFMDASFHEFDQNIAEVVELQNLLRRAWTGDSGPTDSYRGVKGHFRSPFAIFDDEVTLNAFELLYDGPLDVMDTGWKPSHKYEKILLATGDLWKLICYSILRDFSAGKTGVCGNPDCPAPYYLKRRKDQKYCESGCSAYAQRQYALNWWHENRQGKRAKKRGRPSLT